MKTVILSVLLLCFLNPVFMEEEVSQDSSASQSEASPLAPEEPAPEVTDSDTDVVADEGDSQEEAPEEEAPVEDAAPEEEEGENNHNIGFGRGSWCMNNIVPCRDECCRLNWWGRRRCCYWKPNAPCCGGFQWHFPGYLVASTWEGAVPNNLGHHYHHGHPTAAVSAPAVSSGSYTHEHEHTH